jgi:hypothetical protein
VKDFSVSKETNDLGIVVVNLTADILLWSSLSKDTFLNIANRIRYSRFVNFRIVSLASPI